MKTIRQWIRQPTRFAAGVLIVAIAVAVLSVCLGQAVAADQTQAAMERHFTTVALQTLKHRYEDRWVDTVEGKIQYRAFLQEVPQEIKDLIGTLTREHPELVKTVANPGLASAYIPALTPDNPCGHQYHYPRVGLGEAIDAHEQEADCPYAGAMLEITAESVEVTFHSFIDGVREDGTPVSMESSVSVTVTGKIESVLSLEEGWEDPTGRRAVLNLSLQSMADLEAMDLEVGGRYLVSGTNYEDGNWKLKGEIARRLKEDGVEVDWWQIDTDRIRPATEQEQQRYGTAIPVVAVYEHSGKTVTFSEQFFAWHDAVTMDVIDRFTDGAYAYIRHETGGYPTMDYTRYLTDANGNRVQITEAQWLERYELPLIARLDGTAAEFLAGEEGQLWQRQLAHMQIDYHAFPVIGVEKLGHIADFSRENARIVAGRDFTEEELRGGSKVCILSQTLAAANGISVGDTLRPRFYNYDHDDPNQVYISEGRGVINPWAYRFTNTTPWAAAEEYTVIGLYRQDNAWGDVSENLYAFTPNTIFVPHASVASDMDYGDQGFFQTLVLQNGAVGQFRALVEEAGYEGLFAYYDQGYTAIVGSLANYRQVARKAVTVGLGVYAGILLLFLLLFPGSQGKTLATMTALGARRGQRAAQVLASGAGILLPGSLIGAITGMLLWGNVVARMAQSADAVVTLKMDPWVLIGITLAQLAIALALTALLALPMSRNRGIQKRK